LNSPAYTEFKTAAVANGELTIRYALIGSGKPLVLLHGFTDRIESWAELGYVDPLVKAGYRLILIDQRGHGGSSRPHNPAAYTPRLRADDVVAVLDALAIDCANVLGYSMGGWVALNVARYHPHRVDRLIVGGCHPFGQDMAFYREAVARDIESWIGIVEVFGGPVTEAWKARVRENDILALRAAVAENRPDISTELAGFERPCLFYAGSEDPLRGEASRSAKFLPNARYFEMPGCTHLKALLRADLIVPEVLAFLAEEKGKPAS
jgi:pimeloyl-ACP methyl ester carboxylesterase